jgi:hypothetical protein
LKSQYKGNKSVAKNPTISIGVDDPRVAWNKITQTKSRQGSEIDIIGLDGKSLIGGGLNLTDGSGGIDTNKKPKKVVKVPGVPPVGEPPKQVENLEGDWGSDDSIILTFDFDTTDDANFYIDRFLIKVYNSATDKWYLLRSGFGYPGSTFLNTSSASQELTLSASDLYMALGITAVISKITKVAVATADILNTGEYVEANMPAYVSLLPKPVFTLTAGVDYYVVTLDPANIADALTKGFSSVIVEEKITTETIKANVSLTTGWSQAAPATSNSVIVVYAPDGEHRWVRIRYTNSNGNDSVYSEIQDITPDQFMPPNTDPPDQFTSASIEWVGDDIKVNFALPEENIPTTIKVKLVPYINGVESPTLYSDHYHIIVPSVNFFMIRSAELKSNYNTYYSTFKGYIVSISDQGVPTAGATIVSGPITRSGLLTDIYPTLGVPNSSSPQGIFRVTPSINGYIVDFDLPAGASRLEVYEKSTPWTVIPTNDDLVVYSGLSPANIPTPLDDFETRYVIVRYYDLYGGYSHYSMEKVGQTAGVEVTPIDIGMQSLITYPIKISTNGSIFSGIGDKDANPRVFFNPDGLFAYDADGTPSTQLINSAGAGAVTFITRNAKIAEWSIAEQVTGTAPNLVTRNYIQNDLYASTLNKTYTGISSNGIYSFWAGSGTSLNTDNSALFSVKPNGEVVASKITINGDGTNSLLIDTANFTVDRNGKLTALEAEIEGKLTVKQQSYFEANVNIKNNGYLVAGDNGPATGPNMQISSSGLKALNSNSDATTKIYSSPKSVTVKNAFTGETDTVSGITLWSSKALFKTVDPDETSQTSGFLIGDGIIQSNQILIDSTNERFVIRSTSSSSQLGVIIQASSDSDYSIAVGNLNYFKVPRPAGTPEPIFSVTTSGTMVANDATIRGTIKAKDGGFGYYNPTTAALVNGWNITGDTSSASLTATGIANINLASGGSITVSTGNISLGNYQIKSLTGTDFSIVDTSVSPNQTILTTDTVGGTTVSRIYLGQEGRQVEVAKNAEISGDYSGSAQDYRSGGLRNMFTITVNQLLENPNAFSAASSGSVLLVYTP